MPRQIEVQRKVEVEGGGGKSAKPVAWSKIRPKTRRRPNRSPLSSDARRGSRARTSLHLRVRNFWLWGEPPGTVIYRKDYAGASSKER